MSIHPPRGTDLHNFHMISLLGTASQAAYKELFISLLVTKEPQKKNSCRNKHEDIYHPILNIILFLADDKLSFLSKASLNLTFTLSAPRAKFQSQFKQKHCKLQALNQQITLTALTQHYLKVQGECTQPLPLFKLPRKSSCTRSQVALNYEALRNHK